MTTNALLLRELNGTPKQIVFNPSASFNPSAANDLRDGTSGNRTQANMSPANIATNTYYQSAKVDLGPIWAPGYKVRAAIPFQATPTAGNPVDFYWAPSHSSTAANGNPGGVSGSDSAYTGYSSNAAAAIVQLDQIGSFIVTTQVSSADDTNVQIAEVGILVPGERYGTLVIFQNSGASIRNSSVNFHVVFDPIVPEIEAAA